MSASGERIPKICEELPDAGIRARERWPAHLLLAAGKKQRRKFIAVLQVEKSPENRLRLLGALSKDPCGSLVGVFNIFFVNIKT